MFVFSIRLSSSKDMTTLCLEQLEKIEAGLAAINNDMQVAEKALKGMELCCGVVPKFWKQ